MRAYSEDLRRKIVEAVQRGIDQNEAARSFGVSLSSVKRYVGALRAIARHCHRTSHKAAPEPSHTLAASADPPPLPPELPYGLSQRSGFGLADEEWAQVRPLMPHKPAVGCPPRDHRVVIGAILWVLSTGAFWRDSPGDIVPWRTVYGRYRLWRERGVWRLVEGTLGQR